MTSAGNKPVPWRDAAPTPAVRFRAAPQQQSLALPATAAGKPATPLARATSARQLWLCLYLPALPLEAADVSLPPAAATAAGQAPLYAVFEEEQGTRRVLMASPAAHEAGIHAGLSVNAALALQPALTLAERDRFRERQVLEDLAGWAERFTSFVTLEPPDVLLLEIAASLKLFDGLEALRAKIVTELTALGYSTLPAIAPTPLSATWLARAGSRRSVVAPERLHGALIDLPLACLAWPERVTASLAGMGIEQVGDLLRLPRDGFARRFGSARLGELDRALGRLPDPRAHFRAPQHFREDCDLDGEQDDSELLLGVCRQLLDRLERFLRTRQLAAQRVTFRFYHLDHPATQLTLGSLTAGQSSARWMELMRIRFERVELPAPVIAVRLRAADGQALAEQTAGLCLGGADRHDQPIAPLVERLAARIGEQAVRGMHAVAEHRPDLAFRTPRVFEEAPQCRASLPATSDPARPELLADMRRTERLLLRRPLWLLEEPEPLACRDGRPCRQGPLTLTSGPERIETGWWDEQGVARDYYVARSRQGVYLWVFRDRREGRKGPGEGGGWYLHGMFG